METFSILSLTPRQVASLAYLGIFTFVIMGITACVALILTLLYFIVHLALVTMQACSDCLAIIASTYTASEPFLKLIYLAAVAYILYRIYSKVTRKGATR